MKGASWHLSLQRLLYILLFSFDSCSFPHILRAHVQTMLCTECKLHDSSSCRYTAKCYTAAGNKACCLLLFSYEMTLPHARHTFPSNTIKHMFNQARQQDPCTAHLAKFVTPFSLVTSSHNQSHAPTTTSHTPHALCI